MKTEVRKTEGYSQMIVIRKRWRSDFIKSFLLMLNGDFLRMDDIPELVNEF